MVARNERSISHCLGDASSPQAQLPLTSIGATRHSDEGRVSQNRGDLPQCCGTGFHLRKLRFRMTYTKCHSLSVNVNFNNSG
ncbi:hypothetical protein [Arthrospiribacter ruber]|uniref:Uncharacterized protein n=1 Tax=Arthrospiribacter ruber TaxID=2487934 RepID=A0A951IZQ7_9BACT|nr:hypothetical protein [Arthrospiribacter ruber]MBW3469259.1 hypothetical protein [Arthrospiribacter ruber]